MSVRDQTRAAEDPFIHVRLADSAAEVDAARERMLANFVEMTQTVSAGAQIPLTQRARHRWDAAKAIDWSVRAVDRLFDASGGRGIFLDNPIQRAWRDVHAMRAHVPTIRRRSRLSSVARSSVSRPSTGSSEGLGVLSCGAPCERGWTGAGRETLPITPLFERV